jgi:hypothetical protein
MDRYSADVSFPYFEPGMLGSSARLFSFYL